MTTADQVHTKLRIALLSVATEPLLQQIQRIMMTRRRNNKQQQNSLIIVALLFALGNINECAV
jgi:hypothetical protein